MYDKSMISMREKLAQMFIMGLEGENLSGKNLVAMLEQGLGGVIFFKENIKTETQFKNLIREINSHASIKPLFLSIDQEGGRVERTQNLYGGSKYKSAGDSAFLGAEFIKEQTAAIAEELRKFGLNMNFAPVLDVNTNPENPIIAERSFSDNPEIVASCARISANTYLEHGIIPVGKHFPGHGDTSVDSHISMPVVDLSLEELENVHIYPFKKLIDIPAIMVAHVYYPCFDTEKIPASVSVNIVKKYLRNTLHYQGLIISDDMKMGGIQNYSALEACKAAIKAGVNMFIFRSSDDDTVSLIDLLEKEVNSGNIDAAYIDYSYKKIIETKERYIKSQNF